MFSSIPVISSQLAIYIFLFSILIQVVMSWINPGAYNPVLSVLYSLNEPLLAPARRMIPPMGGLDLSPIVVMVALQLVAILLVRPAAPARRYARLRGRPARPRDRFTLTGDRRRAEVLPSPGGWGLCSGQVEMDLPHSGGRSRAAATAASAPASG